jgi:hypothetical protein
MVFPPATFNLEPGVAVFLLLESTLTGSIGRRFISLARESILFCPYLVFACLGPIAKEQRTPLRGATRSRWPVDGQAQVSAIKSWTGALSRRCCLRCARLAVSRPMLLFALFSWMTAFVLVPVGSRVVRKKQSLRRLRGTGLSMACHDNVKTVVQSPEGDGVLIRPL